MRAKMRRRLKKVKMAEAAAEEERPPTPEWDDDDDERPPPPASSLRREASSSFSHCSRHVEVEHSWVGSFAAKHKLGRSTLKKKKNIIRGRFQT